MRAAGYNVITSDPVAGERILSAAIVTVTVTEGSTAPITVKHTGICKAERFIFAL